MRALMLSRPGPIAQDSEPLSLVVLPIPEPVSGEVLIRVTACGVCHTELDEIEGRVQVTASPPILGHQVVGIVERAEPETPRLPVGTRVGVSWFFSSCGQCEYCSDGRQNLCAVFKATGRDAPGGYAEYMCVPAASAFPIPDRLADWEAAPLLCAGAVGYRALRLAEVSDGERLGLMGFGASAHLVLQLVRYTLPRSPVFVFARRPEEREFALSLGATWAGAVEDLPPAPLHAIIDSTPAWKPVVRGLRSLAPGGRLVVNAIRKEDLDREALLQLDYASDLWLEKRLTTVANVTPRDVSEYLLLAAEAGIRPVVEQYSLDDANRALVGLRTGAIRGASVLRLGVR